MVRFCLNQICDDIEIAFECVSRVGKSLCSLHPSLRDDERIVIAAVRQNGMALEYANNSHKNNMKIVKEAL